MFLLHGSVKRIQWKTTEKKWRQHFLHYKSMGVFLRSSRAANSVVGGPIWPIFELIHNIMHALVTSKFEKDRINLNGDYVMTSIFRRSRAANSVVMAGSVRNSNSYKRLCMSSLPASLKRIRSKTAEKTWWLRFSHYKSMGIISDAQGQLTP